MKSFIGNDFFLVTLQGIKPTSSLIQFISSSLFFAFPTPMIQTETREYSLTLYIRLRTYHNFDSAAFHRLKSTTYFTCLVDIENSQT